LLNHFGGLQIFKIFSATEKITLWFKRITFKIISLKTNGEPPMVEYKEFIHGISLWEFPKIPFHGIFGIHFENGFFFPQHF
jgi:hypothetical protein